MDTMCIECALDVRGHVQDKGEPLDHGVPRPQGHTQWAQWDNHKMSCFKMNLLVAYDVYV